MADAMFEVPHQGTYGDTIYSDNPKESAMKQSMYLRALARSPRVVANSDGSYTVKSYGCADITYEKNLGE